MILTADRIYTLDPQRPTVEALVIVDGEIIAAGETERLRREFSCHWREHVDGAVIPGLTDAHLHLQQYALNLQKVDCETPTLRACLERIAARAAQTPSGAWLLGHGWNQNLWPDAPPGGFPAAADLDAVAPRNPVYLTAKSLHAAWASSAALREAGITAQTPDPAGGRITRDEHGAPTGILFENAMPLVSRAIPAPGTDEIAAALRRAQETLWEMGITGVHDFDRQDCFTALQSLHAAGELRLRVLKSLPIEAMEHAIALGLRSGFGDDFLRIGGLKAFADGALGPHTAAMLAPYENEPGNRGMLLLDAEELVELGRRAVANGLSLAVHAIGDRANHEVLNAFERLLKDRGRRTGDGAQSPTASRPSSLRHRIEHVQLIHPEDAPRLARLGIAASMQPIHAVSDMQMADDFWGERAANAYGWRTQLEHGAVLAFGSDAPVESPNPFWGLHAAVTRQRADGTPKGGWYPEQRLSRREALVAYTQGPAFIAGMEDRLGKLAPGYLADLLVLAADPFEVDPAALREMRPQKVMVGGEWVLP